MRERRAEIIIFSILSIVTFFGGIFFAFSTPPTIRDLCVAFLYSLAAVAIALRVFETIAEGKKVDEDWEQLIKAVEQRNTPLGSAKNPMGLTMKDITPISVKTLRKKRNKNGRRKKR